MLNFKGAETGCVDGAGGGAVDEGGCAEVGEGGALALELRAAGCVGLGLVDGLCLLEVSEDDSCCADGDEGVVETEAGCG